jgi:nucleotide-binding universal stress UspA family protein
VAAPARLFAQGLRPHAEFSQGQGHVIERTEKLARNGVPALAPILLFRPTMILCGTDLSAVSEAVIQAAAAVARKQGSELLLASVLPEEDGTARMNAEAQLEQDASKLRRSFDISVETLVLCGAPDQELLDLARRRQASLIVVGAEGSSKRARRLGSVAERLCQTAQVPVLVVRSAEGFISWSRASGTLRVLVGSGLGNASRSALGYVGTWPDLALTVAHVAWPYGEHYRLGVAGPMPLDHLRPEVHHQLLGDLGRWATEVPCRTSPKLRVTPGWGRIDSHLAQLAQEKEADVLVVGSHQRNLGERIWHGSVSRNALHEAGCSVLCVPERQGGAYVASSPRVVVVPTDFSVLADRAIAFGYAQLGHGGTLHLMHVAGDIAPHEVAALESQLRSRIPSDAAGRGIFTETHVVPAGAAWLAIWQHASRVSADVICMSTHSRDAAASLVLGSQAQAVLQHCRIPVLLVPPDRES